VVVTPVEQEGRPLLSDTDTTTHIRRVERPVQRIQSIADWRKLDRNLSSVSGVVASAPIASGPALAVRGATEQAVLVLGADADRLETVIPINKNLKQGNYTTNGTDVVLGIDLAKDLGVGIGDRVRLRTARGEGQIFIVRGLVDMGNQGLNKTWALMSLRNAQTMLGLGGAVTSILVRVKDIYEADASLNSQG
jgi:lipoprotein-releasing system permease protein